MSWKGEVGRAVERFLDYTDAVIEAYSRNHVSIADASRLSSLCYESLHTVKSAWECVLHASGAAEQAARIRAWLDAFFERSLFKRLERLFRTVQDYAEAAASTSAPLARRRHACQIVATAGRAAFVLLSHVSRATIYAVPTTHVVPTANDCSLRAVQALTERHLMRAVTGAARSMTATSEILRSETAVRQLSGAPYELHAAAALLLSAAGSAAEAVCEYVRVVSELLWSCLHGVWTTGGGGVGQGGAGPSSPWSIPFDIMDACEDFAGTQLLAAAAGAVLADPWVGQLQDATTAYQEVCKQAHNAAFSCCRALVVAHTLWGSVVQRGGREERRLAAGLLRALRHRDVQRLQVALLDQLAVHAGMGAGLVEEAQGGEARQQQGGQQGQQDTGGWEGSSGTWWLAREGERQGKLLGLDSLGGEGSCCDSGSGAGGGSMPWRLEMEDAHCHVLYGTLFDWVGVPDHLAAEAGVAPRPPPLLAARLAARAMEAACRLCRGQGLGGAYAPAPEWQLAKAQVMMLHMWMPDATGAAKLPAAVARACLPYWLEAGGWAAALLTDAVAAAMGRAPATQRQWTPCTSLHPLVCREGSQADTQLMVMLRMRDLAQDGAFGLNTLPAAAQDDVRRPLFRCGLAATLDHTVRLAYSAQHVPPSSSTSSSMPNSSTSSSMPQQAQPQPSFKAALDQAGVVAAHILLTGVVPFLQPPPAASAAPSAFAPQCGVNSMAATSSSSCCGGGGAAISTIRQHHTTTPPHYHTSSSCGGGGAAGGAEGDERHQHQTHQLGLVCTLAKEAAFVARELEEGLGAAGAAVGQQGGQGAAGRLLERAKDVLGHLCLTMGCVQGEVRRRAGSAHGSEEGAASGGKEGGEEAALGWDAECVDEVHEALALAARATSNLAALLAWQLAADLAAAAAVDGGGSVVPLPDVHARGAAAVLDALYCVAQGWHGPRLLLLPPAQLLACQPHRLLAAACSLMAALPPDPLQLKRYMSMRVAVMVIGMAAHGTLSSQVRSWLAPSPPAAAAAATTGGSRSGGGESATCGGCLAAPLQSVVRHAAGQEAPYAAALLALLKIASGEVEAKAGVPCRAGGRDAMGEADGGFRQCAAAMAEEVRELFVNRSGWSPAVLAQLLLPDGSRAIDLLHKELGAGGRPLAPQSILPPPLALPPRRRGPLLRLRVCGNPRCCNFAGEYEGALPLRRCGGCGAVRYCGAECQKAHWREGHKAECRRSARGERG